MQIIVHIPTPLQKLTKNKEEVKATGTNIRELLSDLEKRYPGIRSRICDEEGNIRKFINVYVNDEDIRFHQEEETPIQPGDKVSIIPSIAGGNHAT